MSDERPGLLEEIHRRSIWQVVTVYGVGAWFALEVVQGIVEAGNLPDWLPGMALVLLIIGFPMVIATAVVQQGWSRHAENLADTGGAQGTAAQPGGAGEASAAHRLFTWRNALMGGVSAFALWGVVATALLVVSDRSGTASAAGRDGTAPLLSIAVLPFENLSPDPDNAYFADGIHEDVLTQLSKIGALTVISRTSVMGYRGTDKPMATIGSELGVGAIVEGSVRRAGDEVRITAQLIDARTDEHLWADNFDRQLSAASLFSIQSEIAQRIADALSATLSPTAERQITRTPTEDLAAYDFYLRGRTLYELYNAAGNEEAIRLFKEAIARDPSYPEPWAGLADAYAQGVNRLGYSLAWADSAEAMASRALELDPELSVAHKALANAYTVQDRIALALEANLRAIELDPSYSAPINNAGVQYSNLGRFDEALRMYTRAYRLEPNTGFSNSNLAFSLEVLGFLDRAEARARELLRLEPDNGDAVGVLRNVFHARGQPEQALELSTALVGAAPDVARHHVAVASDASYTGDMALVAAHAREALRTSPDGDLWGKDHNVQTLLGMALLRTEPGEARSLLESTRTEMIRRLEDNGEASWIAMEVSATSALLGRTAEALDWAERAYDMSFRWHRSLLSPAYAAIRDEPRWRDLIARMEQDVAEQRANVERWEAEGSLP